MPEHTVAIGDAPSAAAASACADAEKAVAEERGHRQAPGTPAMADDAGQARNA